MSSPVSDKQELTIIRPPDFIFKYRSVGRLNAAQEIIQQQQNIKQGMFKFIGIKYPSLYNESDKFFKDNNLERDWFKYPVVFSDGKIYVHTECPPLTEEEEKMGGQLACFENVPFPSKGHPFPEAFPFVNLAKRFTRTILDSISKDDIPFIILFSLFSKKKKSRWLSQKLVIYNESCKQAMRQYILDERYMTKYGREILHFVFRMLVKFGIDEAIAHDTAECLASQIDWDSAYWMRLGDAFASTTNERMLKNPQKELKLLADLFKERNPSDPVTGERLKKGVLLLAKLLYVPRYKRIFKECIAESEFENFQFDKADEYHSWVYGDYNYAGLPNEERFSKYNDYHTQHPPFPERIVITG